MELAIRDALQENFRSGDLIFVTGGLGPTTDDLTREITAEFSVCELILIPTWRTTHHRTTTSGGEFG